MRKTKSNINNQTLNKVTSQKNDRPNYDENSETKSYFKTSFIKNQLLASKVDLLKEIKSDQCSYYKYLAIKNQLILSSSIIESQKLLDEVKKDYLICFEDQELKEVLEKKIGFIESNFEETKEKYFFYTRQLINLSIY